MRVLFLTLFLVLSNRVYSQTVNPGDERYVALAKLKKLVSHIDSVAVKGQLQSYHVQGITAFGTNFSDVQLFMDREDRVGEIWMNATLDSCTKSMNEMEKGIPGAEILHVMYNPDRDILLVRAPDFDMAVVFECQRHLVVLEITEKGKNRRFGEL